MRRALESGGGTMEKLRRWLDAAAKVGRKKRLDKGGRDRSSA